MLYFIIFLILAITVGMFEVSQAKYPKAKPICFIAGFGSILGLYVYFIVVIKITDILYPNLILNVLVCYTLLGVLAAIAFTLYRLVGIKEASERRKIRGR